MRNFNAVRKAGGSPATTRFCFIWAMHRLDRFFDCKRPFKKMTKEDLVRYWEAKSHFKSNTERKAMKVFFQWLYGLEKGDILNASVG